MRRQILLTVASLSGSAFATSNRSAFVVSSAGNILPQVSSLNTSSSSSQATYMTIDPEYPGTAVERMLAARARVMELAATDAFSQKWEDVRRSILWCGGLRDMPDAIPGQGYTGHSFNDFNHVDLTAMRDAESDNQNEGRVAGIAYGNPLGTGIRLASLPELGPGGSWSTCAMGCNGDPPRDVAHIQFRARIAFKLVWVPNPQYDTFVLVDDDGALLAKGKPSGSLPALRERQNNYRIVQGSKYSKEADAAAKSNE